MGLVFNLNFQVKLVELLLVEVTRCIQHDIASGVVLRESDTVAD